MIGWYNDIVITVAGTESVNWLARMPVVVPRIPVVPVMTFDFPNVPKGSQGGVRVGFTVIVKEDVDVPVIVGVLVRVRVSVRVDVRVRVLVVVGVTDCADKKPAE
jgi:hypothetical protein